MRTQHHVSIIYKLSLDESIRLARSGGWVGFEEFEQLLIYAIALQTLHKVISFEHALSFLLPMLNLIGQFWRFEETVFSLAGSCCTRGTWNE